MQVFVDTTEELSGDKENAGAISTPVSRKIAIVQMFELTKLQVRSHTPEEQLRVLQSLELADPVPTGDSSEPDQGEVSGSSESFQQTSTTSSGPSAPGMFISGETCGLSIIEEEGR